MAEDRDLSTMDAVIVDAANTYMHQFNLEEFKETHKRLYITIKQSMQDYSDMQVKKIIDHQKLMR